jgi:hypothetical protein
VTIGAVALLLSKYFETLEYATGLGETISTAISQNGYRV